MIKKLIATVLTSVSMLLTLSSMTLSHAADNSSSRLDRIRETRILVAGYREMSVPFSYLNNGKPSGFGVELTERVAASLRNQLDLPDLKIRWNAMTLSTRIPLMTTNTVDIACTTDTHSRLLEEKTGFSLSFYITETGMVVSKASTAQRLEDLAGKRISTPNGSTMERKLREKIAKDNLNIELRAARTNRQALQFVLSGEADAYINADSIVAGELFRQPDAAHYRIVPLAGYQEAFACLLPKGDPAFKRAVDEVLAGMMKNGEMEALYSKWFVNPIPPFGIGMKLPLNEATRNLYQAPKDQALE